MSEQNISVKNKDWLTVCKTSDLVKDSGVCALVEQGLTEKQIAIFHLPNTEKKVYAVDNMSVTILLSPHLCINNIIV